jgi:energy-coupling factor transporter ATP-binding protein EcfA2
MRHNSSSTIVGIEVDQLFGSYTYNLALRKDAEANRLLLLYGDNGSGKTRILSLMHHLLSRSSGRGHLTYLARTEFKSFSVIFSNDLRICAYREHCDTGAYRISLSRGSKIINEVQVHARKTSDDVAVRNDDIDDRDLEALYDQLSKDEMSIYFLTDDSNLHGDQFDPPEKILSSARHNLSRVYSDLAQSSIDLFISGNSRGSGLNIPVDQQLVSSIQRAETWIRKQALNASSRNDASFSNIYTEIISLLGEEENQSTDEILSRSLLVKRVRELAQQTERLSSFGLTSAFPVRPLLAAIQKVDESRVKLISQVLVPFFKSVEARNCGLEAISRRLSPDYSLGRRTGAAGAT